MMVECKAPHIALTHEALGQMMQDNRQLSVEVLVLTNGMTHFCWQLDQATHQFKAIEHIPTYQELLKYK